MAPTPTDGRSPDMVPLDETCPKCGSRELGAAEPPYGIWQFITDLPFLPLGGSGPGRPDRTRWRRCRDCDHRWRSPNEYVPDWR